MFTTPDGMHLPTMVLFGTTNAVTFVQFYFVEIFPRIFFKFLLAWLDDILFKTKIFWCGLLVSAEDVRYDPKR